MSETEGMFDTKRLIKLLEFQRTLYRRLRALMGRQKALVTQDDTQPLLALLAERQKLVDGLVGLNGKLAVYRQRWTEVYGSLDEASRQYVSEMLEEANTALGAVLQNDAKDTSTLSVRHHTMADRVAAVDSTSRTIAAYTAVATAGHTTLTDKQV